MNKLGKKAFLSTDFSAFKQEFLEKSETLCLISLLYSWFQFVQRVQIPAIDFVTSPLRP